MVALEGLSDADGLTARPSVMAVPVLRVLFGSISEEAGYVFGSSDRRALELELHSAILTACSPHVGALTPIGGQQLIGSKGAALDLHFKEHADARLRRQALADEGCISLQSSRGLMHVPVRAQPGRIPSDCAQVRVHGLPPEFHKKGIIATLLACAGYVAQCLGSC